MTDPLTRLRSELSDRYTIERELGRGGMATVYLARDVRHDRLVAVKVLRPELADSLGPERFLTEIKLCARLQHPHILTVLDSGETAGQLWFTMPFVEGESLRDRLSREKQLPVNEAVRIARETALALDYAHRHGVIHRDIKPENILLSDGQALLADFGIGRALAAGGEHLTATGTAIGTPAYMSPEQAAGERDLDARSDIYALGTVLYEMLAGETPFAAPTAQAMIARRFTETPKPLRAVRDTVPEPVEHAVQKSLARTAADRFATAADFAQAIGTSTTTPAAATPPPPAPRPRRRMSTPLAMLGLGFILGLGGLFAWSRNQPAAEPAGSGGRLVAVLPFENVGAADDEYFADGMTDEVRGKLSALPGLRVIASGSSKEYKKSTKSIPEIARELGVEYVLVAKVRWAKAPDGTSRVRVSPELVQVTGGTPTTRWQQPFDANLTDVFQVQADIAGRVAQALDLALGAEAKQQLAERPTRSLAAYDLFLRANANIGMDPPSLRRRIALLEESLAADSSFAQAWASLSGSLSSLFNNSVPDPAIAARARAAADRALALDPEGVPGRMALGNWYLAVRKDPIEAEKHFTLALRAAPNDPRILRGIVGVERSLGRWEAALAHARQATHLDPRSVGAINTLQGTLTWMRRYPEALAASEAALALAPGDLSISQDKAMVYVAQGNLAAAREVIRQVSPAVKPSQLAAFFATYWDMYWVLEEAQQQLLPGLTVADFDGDPVIRSIVLAQLYHLRGDAVKTRAHADTAYRATLAQLRDSRDDPQRTIFLGLELAYMGRKAEAIAAGERGLSLLPLAGDAVNGPYYQHQIARIFLLVGEPEKAVDRLEPLLKQPYYLSPGWLRIDPTFAPLKGNPRFERLIAG